MSDKVIFTVFICIIIFIIVVNECGQTIFPIMDDDEYFVDEYNCIHGNNCPYQSVPWFSQKHSKYDILIKKEHEICKECLSFEEDKLMELHYINLDLREKSLRINGASEEYIEK